MQAGIYLLIYVTNVNATNVDDGYLAQCLTEKE